MMRVFSYYFVFYHFVAWRHATGPLIFLTLPEAEELLLIKSYSSAAMTQTYVSSNSTSVGHFLMEFCSNDFPEFLETIKS